MKQQTRSVSSSIRKVIAPTIEISPDTFKMVVVPKSIYKLIRALNHWIDNLIQFCDSDVVSDEDEWYIRWKSSYSIIKSSSRNVNEIHQMLTGKVDGDRLTPYELVMFFVDWIPKLRLHYDIQKLDEMIDPNNFIFELNLFYTDNDDPDNRYNSMRSTASKYVPFDENRSLLTWHTKISAASTSSQKEESNEDLPREVDFGEKPIPISNFPDANNGTTGNVAKPGIHIDTTLEPDPDLSLSPNEISTNALNPETSKKASKNQRKSENLRQLVSDTCKNEIKSEMGIIRQEMGDFKSSIQNDLEKHTSKLVALLEKTLTTSNISQNDIPPEPKVLPIYRQNMPSPRTRNNPVPDAPFSHPGVGNFDTAPKGLNDKDTSTVHHPPSMKKFHSNVPFQRSGTLTFMYGNESYELRDGDFAKHSADLIEVTAVAELVQFYKQLQSMAVTYNIFVSPFNNLQHWDKTVNTLPSTCIFQMLDVESNTVDAYRRMKTALYNKLTKAKFHNQEYKAIIKHGGVQQDGFEILYDLMTHCHPKLVTATIKYRQINHKPDFDRNDNIFTYIAKLQVWHDIENINNHQHTEDDMLNIVMEKLQMDTRYELALAGIKTDLTLRDTIKRTMGQAMFPEGLKLHNLPGTIMSYYTEDEKKIFFPTDAESSVTVNKLFDDQELQDAIIHSMSFKRPTRQHIDAMCPGCGRYGHDIFQNGCDYCAQFVLSGQFFKKYPNMANKIVKRFKDFQLERQKSRPSQPRSQRQTAKHRSAPSSSPSRKPYNLRSRKANIKTLQDALSNVMNDQDSSASSSEKFEDAVSTDGESDKESQQE